MNQHWPAMSFVIIIKKNHFNINILSFYSDVCFHSCVCIWRFHTSYTICHNECKYMWSSSLIVLMCSRLIYILIMSCFHAFWVIYNWTIIPNILTLCISLFESVIFDTGLQIVTLTFDKKKTLTLELKFEMTCPIFWC